jgi:membrane-associated phospholipid phosphatase
MIWFTWLEKKVAPGTEYTKIHVYLDDIIPFCEWFVIPYLLWFVYIAGIMAFILFTSRKEFYEASAYMFLGMGICLFICTVWPNGQDLRIEEFTGNNFLVSIMKVIYSTDTSTNVFPSIHVYNSVGAAILIFKSHILKKYNWVKISSVILSTLIILSTVFLNQHSIMDVFGGLILAALMYIPVYCVNWSMVREDIKKKKLSSKRVTTN